MKKVLLTASAALLFTLTACGPAATGTADPQPGGAAQNAAASDRPGLTTIVDPVLGEIVADRQGWVLYRFDADTSEPPKSNCENECLAAWPASPAVDPADATGIAPGIVGTYTRSDGSAQAMLSNYILYRYSGDKTPGETKGQGSKGKWWAVRPDGKRAQAAGQARGPLHVVDHPQLGKIVVDADGYTLYRHKGDTDDPMASTCNGECAVAWPPVPAIDSAGSQGLTVNVTNFKREDGTVQSSLDCWPLYRFAKDTAPGQVNGHGGADGTFFAVTPDGKFANNGKPIATTTTDGNGYTY